MFFQDGFVFQDGVAGDERILKRQMMGLAIAPVLTQP
jgi:hypothetical protein